MLALALTAGALATAALGAPSGDCPSPASDLSPVERHGALRVRDGILTDIHHCPVILRGVSLYWSQWAPAFYSPRTIRWLKRDWKIDVVRIAMGVEPNGYLQDPEREWAKVKRVIDAAIDCGLYVIVDWHAHDPHPEEAAEFFSGIAQSYGMRDNIIYEPYNEPRRGLEWASTIKPYHLTVLRRIRQFDPDNLVVAGTPTWSQDVDVAAADPIVDPNIAYSLHFYAGSHRAPLRLRADQAMASGAALFVTEWGSSSANGSGALDFAETARWLNWTDNHHISVVNWSISDKAESSAALAPGTRDSRWKPTSLTPSGTFTRHLLRREDMAAVQGH